MSTLGDVSPNDPIEIALDDDVATDPAYDAARIELPDGSVTINLGPVRRAPDDVDFYANLAEHMPDSDLYAVADDLIQGIEEDERSRSEWLEERADGIKLLALKIDKPDSGEQGGGGRSKARDTLLLEAVLRFQANASGELMPVDGPVKIRDDAQGGSTTQRSQLADDLEKDLNHYLTSIATEYYPDTDRMLFWTGFGGSGFKKVYRCPIRRRPVSEAVDAADIIVSNAATDLANAERVTHVVKMPRATLKRMQILKAYRDIGLVEPTQNLKNPVDQAKEGLSGVKPSQRPKDEPYSLYECYCQIDLPGFEHEENGEPTGLPLPFKVTVDRASREILEIRRNWREGDDLRLPRQRFVKFPFVPGLGFYDIGLLHIAGNPTVASTALLRVMIDAGIFGNFPGFLHAKQAGRQQTNVLDVMPGSSVGIDTGGVDDIRKAVFPLPYKTPDGSTLNLKNQIEEQGQRVAGTAELQVAEGRQDAPVGTTIAMIEQATKVLDAVHKRLHRAQGEEFSLLRDLFKESPDDFWRLNRSPSRQWDEQTFVAALNDCNFVPAADPNTSSHIQRIMKAQAVYQMAQADPASFKKGSVYEWIGATIRVADFKSLLADSVANNEPPAVPPPDPKAEAAAISAQAALITANARQAQVGVDAQKAQSETQVAAAKLQSDQQQAQSELERSALVHQADLKSSEMVAGAKIQAEREKATAEIVSAHAVQAKDHAHDAAMAGLGAALRPDTKPSGNA